MKSNDLKNQWCFLNYEAQQRQILVMHYEIFCEIFLDIGIGPTLDLFSISCSMHTPGGYKQSR